MIEKVLNEKEINDIRYALIFSMKHFDEKGNFAEKALSDRLEKICDNLSTSKKVVIYD